MFNSIPNLTSKVKLPGDHLYFPDCERENNARFILWSMTRKQQSAWFISQTFGVEESIRSADRKYKEWVNRLTQGLIDTGGGQLRWVRATEWQIREVIHFHSIVQGTGLDLLSRKSWEHRWQSLGWNTGFCRIHDADKNAAPYLAKYTSKRLGGQLQWGGYWQGLSVPASVSCGHSLLPVSSVESTATSTAR